jgi:hypothetical protein
MVERNTGFDAFADAAHRSVDRGDRRFIRLHGNIGQIDIDRQTRHVADEEIDGRAALEGKTFFDGDQGQKSDQESDLPAIDVSERHRDPPAP